MGASSIPVDLLNPGQVFACMGFLEAAHALCGPAEGGFHWASEYDPTARFDLHAEGCDDPVAHVLEFVAGAEVLAAAPNGWAPAKADAEQTLVSSGDRFPARAVNETSLPIVLKSGNRAISLGHWTDGSSRDEFKLYAGNRSAQGIARVQVKGKATAKGVITVSGIAHLLNAHGQALVDDPLGITVPLAGSFNLDARCAWLSIDAGYSPNDHNQQVVGSPVVEMMGAWGLEHARPQRLGTRHYHYAAWAGALDAMLARAQFAEAFALPERRVFAFRLGLSGKNKIVQFAEEEKGS